MFTHIYIYVCIAVYTLYTCICMLLCPFILRSVYIDTHTIVCCICHVLCVYIYIVYTTYIYIYML